MSEINELKEQLAEMQQRINELEQDQMEQPVQRRNMLKAVAGVAAGAAVGGLGFARSAAAADGDSIAIGDETNIADPNPVGNQRHIHSWGPGWNLRSY